MNVKYSVTKIYLIIGWEYLMSLMHYLFNENLPQNKYIYYETLFW